MLESSECNIVLISENSTALNVTKGIQMRSYCSIGYVSHILCSFASCSSMKVVSGKEMSKIHHRINSEPHFKLSSEKSHVCVGVYQNVCSPVTIIYSNQIPSRDPKFTIQWTHSV